MRPGLRQLPPARRRLLPCPGEAVGNAFPRDVKYGLDVFEPSRRQIVVVAEPMFECLARGCLLNCEPHFLERYATVVICAENLHRRSLERTEYAPGRVLGHA